MPEAATINSSDDDVLWPAMDVAPNATAGALAAPSTDSSGDTGHLARGSAWAYIGSLQREGAVMAHRMGYDNLENYLSASADQSHQTANDHLSQVTPETMDLANAPITSGQFWSSPGSALKNKLVSSALPFATTMAGSWYLPSEVAIGAVNSSAAAADAMADMVGKMPDKQLQDKEPYYKQLRDAGMSESESRDKFIDETIAQNHTDLWAGAAGAVTGAAFPAGQWAGAGRATAKMLGIGIDTGSTVAKLGKRAAVSGVEAGLAGVGADLGTNLAINQAAGSIGGEQKSPEDILSSAVSQFVGQGAMGAGFGAAAREHSKVEEVTGKKGTDYGQVAGQTAVAVPTPQPEQPEGGGAEVRGEPIPGVEGILSAEGAGSTKEGLVPSEKGVTNTQTGGEATVARTPRNYKTKTKSGAEVAPDAPASTAADTGKAIPANPVADDQKLALDAASSRPTIDSSKTQPPDVQSKVAEPVVDQSKGAIAQDQQGAPPTGGEPVGPRTPQPPAGPQPSPIVADSLARPTGGPRPPTEPENVVVPTTPRGTYADARDLVTADQKASTSYIQRKLGLTYTDALKAVKQLENEGVISPADKNGRRTVLMKPEDVKPEPIEAATPTSKSLAEAVQSVSEKPKPELSIVKPEVQGEAAAQAAREAELKASIPQEPTPKGKNLTAKEKANRASNNLAAKAITDKYPIGAQDVKAMTPDEPGGVGARNALKNRLVDMVNEAENAKVKIPDEFNKMSNPAHDHAPEVLLLREAKDFLSRINTAKDKDFQNYLLRENDLRHGRYEDVLQQRRSEAEEALARQGKGPRAGGTSLDATEEKASAEDIEAYRKGLSVPKRIERAAEDTQEPKSPEQAEAGNYPKGHLRIESQDITIETAHGQTRSGVDEQGKPWSVKSPTHYGYIRRTVGADHDNLDVHINPHMKGETGKIFVMNQLKPSTGEFD